MASKKALLKGMQVKVENRSGFDKSRFNALTTGVGTITPIAKQLLIPSSGRLSVKIAAQLPPLATDAYLRTHLKVEAFFVPMRIMYAGFESWYSGKEHYNEARDRWERQELPYYFVPFYTSVTEGGGSETMVSSAFNEAFGPGTLLDYLGVKFPITTNNTAFNDFPVDGKIQLEDGITGDVYGQKINLWPMVAYHMIYDHFYRNKQISRPLFSPPSQSNWQSNPSYDNRAFYLPYVSWADKIAVYPYEQTAFAFDPMAGEYITDKLLDNSHLWSLHQRNYGDDYFTCAIPSATMGSAVSIDTSGGSFTIASLRAQNAMAEFRDNNRFASPDMQAVNLARYGVDLSDALAQHPVLLGSADFTMFTSGVEQTANTSGSNNNPYAAQVGARYGRAHAEGTDFVCDFNVKEPGYLMVLATLVPEANYAYGISHDMKIFTQSGDLVDLPVALLEHTGPEPISSLELDFAEQMSNTVFGYAPQRYLWHKAGQVNEVHGLFRKGMMLESFVPQRTPWNDNVEISSDFLQVATTDLDSLLAADTIGGDNTNSQIVMIDSAIELFVSEPLSESALPALSNPALEHGRSVYLNTSGSKLG